jgi:lysophospholipase L1-like esterase
VKRLLAGTDDFAAQVDKVVAAPEFPALHLAFIGHNNLDWYYDVHKYGLDRDDYVRSLPAGVGAAYEAQLRRLVDRAREASRAGRETEIVVYGLLNADDGLDLVRRAVEEHRRDPERFPHIETLDSRMPSFLPAHAAATKALAKAVNDELERRVTRLRRELGNDANVRIRFSRILTEAPWRDLGLLSPYDGLHLSPQGMTYVSELVAEDLEAHGSLLPISATD